LYEKGQGVERDYKEAAKWYRLAGVQGVTQAAYNLGLLYANGHGVAQDEREAAVWYGLAAKQGHTQAQHDLALRSEKEQGS
jgi:TPR repeat protein